MHMGSSHEHNRLFCKRAQAVSEVSLRSGQTGDFFGLPSVLAEERWRATVLTPGAKSPARKWAALDCFEKALSKGRRVAFAIC